MTISSTTPLTNLKSETGAIPVWAWATQGISGKKDSLSDWAQGSTSHYSILYKGRSNVYKGAVLSTKYCRKRGGYSVLSTVEREESTQY